MKVKQNPTYKIKHFNMLLVDYLFKYLFAKQLSTNLIQNTSRISFLSGDFH